MLSLKAKDMAKSVIIAILAIILYLVFNTLVKWICDKVINFSIEKTSIIDWRTRILSIVLYHYIVIFVVSGTLTGIFVAFVPNKNKMFTTILTLLFITIFFILAFLWAINRYGKSCIPLRLPPTCFNWVLSVGCTLFGIWIVSRRKRKTRHLSLPDDNIKSAAH
jgi:hypothetical protein